MVKMMMMMMVVVMMMMMMMMVFQMSTLWTMLPGIQDSALAICRVSRGPRRGMCHSGQVRNRPCYLVVV